jgi:hypothetical protein
MGAKKKEGKSSAPDEDDTSTKDFLTFYKRYCKELEVQPFKKLEEKVTELIEEGGKLSEILINEKIGEFGAKALFSALKAVK